MSGYAIRNDGQGWRAVDGPESCNDDEKFQTDQPGPIVVAPPDEPEISPIDKLKAFLAANPDVAALLGG